MLRFFYFGTGVLAACGALLCTAFAIVGGLGWWFVLPTFFAVMLLVGGLGRGVWKPRFGTKLSMLGAVLCSGALVGDLVELVRAIPSGQSGQFATLLPPPAILVLVMGVHGLVAVWYLQTVNEEPHSSQ